MTNNITVYAYLSLSCQEKSICLLLKFSQNPPNPLAPNVICACNVQRDAQDIVKKGSGSGPYACSDLQKTELKWDYDIREWFCYFTKPIRPTSTSLLGSVARSYKKSVIPCPRGISVVRFTLWLLLLPMKEFPVHSAQKARCVPWPVWTLYRRQNYLVPAGMQLFESPRSSSTQCSYTN
jgi:hypothetical protein